MKLRTILRHNYIPPIILAAAIFLLAFFSPVTNTNSDPRMSLLVSQNILENRSFKLDAYRETIDGELAGFIDGVLFPTDDHIFYYFPLGTPIFFTPFVWLVNQFGWDMSSRIDEGQAQNLFSALVAATLFLVIYATARNYLKPLSSLLITAVAVLGSSLISTVSAALWSMNLAALFIALSLWLIGRFDSGRSQTVQPVLLGAFLFAAYLCRPSTATFIVCVLVYLFFTNRSAWFKTAAVAAGLLALFFVFSRVVYGQWLPPYYNETGRFQLERPSLWTALLGNLISPSRGIFIFSPFLVSVAIGVITCFGKLRKRPLFWLILAWFFLLLMLLARSTKWYGGYAYGPRLLTETMPGLALLTVFVWRELKQLDRPRLRSGLASAFLLLGLIGIWINSYQGLFNQHTKWWNGAIPPDVNRRNDYLLDWKYPQFLATNDSLCRRNQEYVSEVIGKELFGVGMIAYRPGDKLDYLSGERIDVHDLEQAADNAVELSSPPFLLADGTANTVRLPIAYQDWPVAAPADTLFLGWSPPASGFRWSFCRYAQIAFKLSQYIHLEESYLLEVESGALDGQPVEVWLNGERVGTMTFSGGIEPPSVEKLEVPGGLLRPGEVNLLAFDIPAARSPGREDSRILGLSFVSLKFSSR